MMFGMARDNDLTTNMHVPFAYIDNKDGATKINALPRATLR